MNFLKEIKTEVQEKYIRIIQKLNFDEYIFYVGGSEYLPPPLSQNEEKEYIPEYIAYIILILIILLITIVGYKIYFRVKVADKV